MLIYEIEGSIFLLQEIKKRGNNYAINDTLTTSVNKAEETQKRLDEMAWIFSNLTKVLSGFEFNIESIWVLRIFDGLVFAAVRGGYLIYAKKNIKK